MYHVSFVCRMRKCLQDAQAVPGIDLGLSTIRTVMNNMTLSLECEQAELATNPENYGGQ